MEILDLKVNSNFSKQDKILFNKIADSKIVQFHNIITKISKINKNNFDWWISGPASRDTLNSSFYYYFCLIHFINQKIKKNNEYILVLDSIELTKIVKKILYQKNNKSIIRYEGANLIAIKIRNYKSIILQIFYRLVQKIVSYLTKKKQRFNKTTKCYYH